jgi:hypothetical protein
LTCNLTCNLTFESVPALTCDAPEQGILLRYCANADTESQVESEVITQVEIAIHGT